MVNRAIGAGPYRSYVAPIAAAGEQVVIMAGVPFGTAGSTNMIHVVRVIGDELEDYE